MKKWKFVLIYVLIITTIFSIFIFYCDEFVFSNSTEYSGKIYSDKEIMAMVTERLTYERENLRYYEQQEEFERLIEQFHKREVSAKQLLNIWFIFYN